MAKKENIKGYIEYIREGLGLKSLNKFGFFIAEPCFMSFDKKRHLIEFLIEQQDIPQIFFCQQPLLSLYSLGLLNGAILESGEGVT